MGKTPVPLTIWVAEGWENHPTINALRAKGHSIHVLERLSYPDEIAPDLILHPNAHRWTEAFWTHPALLETAMKKARAVRKAKKKETS